MTQHSGAPDQLPLPLERGYRPALGREDFLVHPANAEAVRWLDLWPVWPAPGLVVHGPEGCGKSHLCTVWQARSGARFLHGEELLLETPPEIGTPPTPVAVDDVQAVAGWPDREEALFHLVNRVRSDGRHLLILCDQPPAHLGLRLPDLRSRLCAFPTVGITRPDDVLLAQILVKLFADRQLHPPTDVIGYLVARMERSFAAARAIVARLDQVALARKKPISLRLVAAVLREDAADVQPAEPGPAGASCG